MVLLRAILETCGGVFRGTLLAFSDMGGSERVTVHITDNCATSFVTLIIYVDIRLTYNYLNPGPNFFLK